MIETENSTDDEEKTDEESNDDDGDVDGDDGEGNYSDMDNTNDWSRWEIPVDEEITQYSDLMKVGA